MKISNQTSDGSVLEVLGQRLSHHRLNKNQTQEELAAEAGISSRTLVRIEHGESSQTTNLIRLLRALGLLENIDVLIPEPAPSPIQQLQLRGKRRARASSKGRQPENQAPWSWGDEE